MENFSSSEKRTPERIDARTVIRMAQKYTERMKKIRAIEGLDINWEKENLMLLLHANTIRKMIDTEGCDQLLAIFGVDYTLDEDGNESTGRTTIALVAADENLQAISMGETSQNFIAYNSSGSEPDNGIIAFERFPDPPDKKLKDLLDKDPDTDKGTEESLNGNNIN